jgi:hypothetical protein
MAQTNSAQALRTAQYQQTYPKWSSDQLQFAQAEVQFTLAGISSEQTKFCHVLSQLDQR